MVFEFVVLAKLIEAFVASSKLFLIITSPLYEDFTMLFLRSNALTPNNTTALVDCFNCSIQVMQSPFFSLPPASRIIGDGTDFKANNEESKLVALLSL